MTTINTTDDLLRAARHNPEFRAAMRRELLGEDLLEMPQRLATLEQGIAAVLEHAAATNRRLDQMDGRLDRMDGRLDGIEGDVKEVKEDIDGLGESFRREVRAQSSYRGNYAQRAAGNDDLSIAQPFADHHGLKRIKARQVSRATLESWLSNNGDLVESLNLRPRAWLTFLRPDVITGINDLFSDNDAEPEFYMAIEASYTGDAEDIHKVTDHAKIMRAVTGLNAYPVVAAVNLDDEMEPEMRSRLYTDPERFIEANDADSALWHPLDSADLRPEEPR